MRRPTGVDRPGAQELAPVQLAVRPGLARTGLLDQFAHPLRSPTPAPPLLLPGREELPALQPPRCPAIARAGGALAVDGKWIRDRALSLCLSDHETGAPVALGFAKEKTKPDDAQSPDGFKREGEQTIALRLYASGDSHVCRFSGFGASRVPAQRAFR